MSNPDPKPVTIDGIDTPLAHVTVGEAMSVISQGIAKLGQPDAQALADGLMRLAASAAGSPIEWNDLLRRELVRADQVMFDRATVYGEWHPVPDPRTEAETDADDKLMAEHNRLADEHGLMSVWSVSGADDLDAPHPYPNAATLVYETISGDTDRGRVWGGDGGRFTAPITGPRWLDLWLAAEAVIQRSGDLHHRFVELFDLDSDRPAELHLTCGS